MKLVTIDLPTRFYDDHVSRDLPGGHVVKELARTTRIQVDRAEFAEILSDARFYASQSWAFDPGLPGLCASAAATVRRMLEADVPDHWKEYPDPDRTLGSA